MIGLGAWKSCDVPRLEVAIASALSFLTQPQRSVRKGPFLPSCKIFCVTLQEACNEFNREFKGHIFGHSQLLSDFQIQQPLAK